MQLRLASQRNSLILHHLFTSRRPTYEIVELAFAHDATSSHQQPSSGGRTFRRCACSTGIHRQRRSRVTYSPPAATEGYLRPAHAARWRIGISHLPSPRRTGAGAAAVMGGGGIQPPRQRRRPRGSRIPLAGGPRARNPPGGALPHRHRAAGGGLPPGVQRRWRPRGGTGRGGGLRRVREGRQPPLPGRSLVDSVSYVAALGWYELLDEPGSSFGHLSEGLMTGGGSPKPAFYAYAAAP